MKLFRIALYAALLLASSISFAQTKPGDLVADVPFPFVVSGRTLPPGHYILNSLTDVVRLYDHENKSVFVATHNAERPLHENSSKMVFHRYGDNYFLAEVWVAGNSIGKALVPSRAEREIRDGGAELEIAVVRLGK